MLSICKLQAHVVQMPWKRSALYYSLHTQLTAPWEAHSLLAEAKAASTTGQPL